MQYKDVPRQWMSANTHLWENSDGKIDKILGVAVSLSRAEMAHTHPIIDVGYLCLAIRRLYMEAYLVNAGCCCHTSEGTDEQINKFLAKFVT